MRKVLIVMVLLILASGLFAKAGLLGIWYGQSSNTVTKQLIKQGFRAANEKPQSLIFVPEKTSDIKMVEVYLSEKNKVAGWKVHFTPALPEDKFCSILNDCIKLHGKEYKLNVSANVIGWNLEDSKNFLLSFDDDQAIQYGMYIHSHDPETLPIN